LRPIELSNKRVVAVLGKGGVGRTTMAAAIASLLSSRGRRVLLFQANAKEKIGHLLGGPPVGEQIVQLSPNLWAVNTNPQAALKEYGLMVLRYETIYKMVFENRVAKSLVRAIPGVDDYSILGKMWWHTTEEDRGRPRWDVIVFDGPATGHAITMLRIPQAILTAVPEGPLTRDAAKVRTLLEDPARTSTILVTLAEEMPTNETIELATRLKKELRMPAVATIANQLYPDRFAPGSVASRVIDEIDPPALKDVLGRARTARARRALNDRYLARLAAELPLPLIKVPEMFVPTLAAPEIEKIAALLGEHFS
jgi:anion-transporting  ArsA/GET3 family ATPase